MNVATNGVFLFYYSRQNYQKIDITIFLHLHFYKKSYAIVYTPPFPPTHKSQIPIGGGWGSCGMQTKGTVLLVCLWHIQTKRTVPLVCGLCAIVYCKNNQGCGLISTALILYDFIGIICVAWWRCVLRRSVCCARLRHGVPNCHACHVADGVKPCRLRSRCADDPSCSQPFAAIAIAG